MTIIASNLSHEDNQNPCTSTDIFPPYVNLKESMGLKFFYKNKNLVYKKNSNRRLKSVAEEYVYLKDEEHLSKSFNTQNAAGSSRRYTSDSEDGGVESESIGAFF